MKEIDQFIWVRGNGVCAQGFISDQHHKTLHVCLLVGKAWWAHNTDCFLEGHTVQDAGRNSVNIIQSYVIYNTLYIVQYFLYL